MDEINKLLKTSEQLKLEYEKYFNTKFPERIIGWWDPVNIEQHPEELAHGIKKMEHAIKQAIKTNTPIEDIPKEQWDHIIF